VATPIFPKVPVAGRAKAFGFSHDTQGAVEQLDPWLVELMLGNTWLGRCGTGKVPEARKIPFKATSEPVLAER
jgi:hypothetical protein